MRDRVDVGLSLIFMVLCAFVNASTPGISKTLNFDTMLYFGSSGFFCMASKQRCVAYKSFISRTSLFLFFIAFES